MKVDIKYCRCGVPVDNEIEVWLHKESQASQLVGTWSVCMVMMTLRFGPPWDEMEWNTTVRRDRVMK